MRLTEANEGDVVEIVELKGGRGFIRKMYGHGIYAGKIIKVIRGAPFNGPLLVEDIDSGGRVMIGRGMADKIKIKDAKK